MKWSSERVANIVWVVVLGALGALVGLGTVLNWWPMLD